ncbi:KTSC domain-containing protein [Haloprofundus salinisoli]|uniref:KTSC domain-containing protein n=1 Tax=Haloprofundus salinisoli TaxID=2876193 RepID=UPI001CC98597|nr:KTSC domain-containing protein [Haloprofundus salinisoli]
MKAVTKDGREVECAEVREHDHGVMLYDGDDRQVGYVPYESLEHVVRTRLPVSSSSLRSVGYDEDEETLELEFHSGGVYEYEGVAEETYEELLHASSRGRYFHENVRGEHDYRRIL